MWSGGAGADAGVEARTKGKVGAEVTRGSSVETMGVVGRAVGVPLVESDLRDWM